MYVCMWVLCGCVCTYVGVEVDTKSREELSSLHLIVVFK